MIKKGIFGALPVMTCVLARAGGNTSWAVPTQVDVVRNEGIMVYGTFGNPNGCTESDRFFVPMGHAQYNQIYALVTTAMITGTKIMAYVDQCAPETWYSVTTTTYNYLDPCCSIYASTSN